MKKLIALLMACTTMTCMFASCGDEETESSDSSASVSEESNEETTTEEETTEAETTTEEVTEEDTTVEEESSETEDDAMGEESTEVVTHEYIDADATAFIGKWECEKMVVEGEEMTDLMGIPIYAVFQLDIKDDNTASMADNMAEYSGTEEGLTYTWGMVSETEIEISNETGAMLLTMEGDKLVGTEEGYDEQIYLVKVDEFTPFDFEEFMNSFELGEETTGDTETASDSETEIPEPSETEEETVAE